MRYLLDTHTLLWYLDDDVRLPANVKSFIEDPGNDILINMTSFWELAIKTSIGKLKL
jgi:PIN domain nuclease of toxin-antitoxin system